MMLTTLFTMLALVTSSYYWQGTQTASGERFNPDGMTCAHRTLPFGTILRVSRGDKFAFCRVNDRGPFIKGRSLDVSRGVAKKIGLISVGVAKVDMEIVGGKGLYTPTTEHIGDEDTHQLKKGPKGKAPDKYTGKHHKPVLKPHKSRHLRSPGLEWDLSSTFRHIY